MPGPGLTAPPSGHQMIVGRGFRGPAIEKVEDTVALWLLLIIAGVVLAILGFAGVGSALIWIGVIVLVVGLVLSFVGRGRASV
jgi:TM2 domain-containing membrane protein YozV